MSKILKEPLVHFLFLGGLIFGYFYLFNSESESENTIVIDDVEYEYLLSLWKNQWKREPNEQDIKAFIDQYLRQEVFYKEALALGLDHNDIIVKRRLAQKMEAVSNDLNAMLNPPTDADLREFYESNDSLFLLPPTYSFRQVLFTNQESNWQQELTSMQVALQSGQDIPKARSLKLSISNEWKNSPLNEINKAFGGDFAFTLDSLPLNQWVGPISSGFGQHLVFISEKNESQLADFDLVKSYVEKEYEYLTELEMQEQVYRDLLEKYQVKITSSQIPEAIKKSYTP
ncbi:peptidylprolyl isomerase [uncultured Algoriphagus sp.]|uniref:peptidylprolyl isomerase n=1 Tax=uncultured Algoriphagus sp. TaxID=417365 RepID=UPI00258C92E4|nr:peptidylprolyl isomerase [uncultured Algoriphagus sp.]